MFEKFLNAKDIVKILDNINEIHKDFMCCCHGRGHALFVAETTEYILKELGHAPRTVELGKIAGLLHDIGVIAGRKSHAKKSAALAEVFLGDADFLSPEERAVIVQAIEDHSAGEHITSAIGAALLIADKIHISQQRIFKSPDLDDFHKHLLELREVKLKISPDIITINYVTTKNLTREILTEDFRTEYPKGHKIPQTAAEFLGRTCRFEINDREVTFS